MNLSGCYTALVTPFKNGAVDYNTLTTLVEQQIAGGVTGLVPVGTTGESPTLTSKEHMKVIEFVLKAAAGRCQIIAGTGANSTAEAIHLSVEAASMGVDATLQVTPYYNKPSAEGLYRHFSVIAEKSNKPIVLYNVPGRTGKEIPLDVVKRLSVNPLVVAVKEAAGSVERVSAIKNLCGDDIVVLSGDDSLALPMVCVGARGVVSVASNIIPKQMSQMIAFALKNDFAAALKIHQQYYSLFKDLFVESNPIPIKAAMADLGMIAEEYRLPLCPMMPDTREKLRQTMKKIL